MSCCGFNLRNDALSAVAALTLEMMHCLLSVAWAEHGDVLQSAGHNCVSLYAVWSGRV